MTRPARHSPDRRGGGDAARQDRHLAVADELPPPPRPSLAKGDAGEVATHRIIASDYDDAEGDDTGPGGVVGFFTGLRFVHQSPGSLLDQVDYARDGAYTIQVEGWWRNANIWFARLIAVPGLTICHLIAWALFTRLSRTIVALIVVPLVLMLANGLPVVSWVVPDWADFTTWWIPAVEAPAGAVG